MKRDAKIGYRGWISLFCLLISVFCLLSFTGCGGGKGTPATTAAAPAGNASASATKQAVMNKVLNTPYLKDIDLGGVVRKKSGKFSLAATAARSATSVTRTLLQTSLAGDCCAFVYAQFELTGTLTFNAADGTMVAEKPIDMFAYGNYELVKDAATGDWNIVKDAVDGLLFTQGNSPMLTETTTTPNSPFPSGGQVELFVTVLPTMFGSDLYVTAQSKSLGLKNELLDDGVSPDAASGDNTYSAAITVPSTAADGDYVFVIDVMDQTQSFDLTSGNLPATDTTTTPLTATTTTTTSAASFVHPYTGLLEVHETTIGQSVTFTSASVSCAATDVAMGNATYCKVVGALADGTTKDVPMDDVQWSVPSGSGTVTEGGIVLPFAEGTLTVHGQVKEGPSADAILNVTAATTTTIASSVTAPTGVTATGGDGSVSVDWEPVQGALGYDVYLAAQTGITPDNITTLQQFKIEKGVFPPVTIDGLTNGTTYFVVVTALGTGGQSAASAEASATPEAAVTSAPSAPANVTATAMTDGDISVTWDTSAGASYYNVYMAAQSGVTKANYAMLQGGMIHPGETSPFTHTGLASGFTYYFVVTAGNQAGESAESAEVSATPFATSALLSAPVNVTATPHDGQVSLAWDAVAGAGFYNIYWASASGVMASNYLSLPNGNAGQAFVTTETISPLTNGTTYYFVVTAFGANGESAASVEVSAMPMAGLAKASPRMHGKSFLGKVTTFASRIEKMTQSVKI